ncbi:hypothetical protein [Streptomyces sp. SID13031]|uniref:hypothetical protein n=1 Tax=Streptomyces sp. SID13031 TaxID=2706046 RepID=UPI0013CCBCCF|nr:hypothetical protein [Streptomyces sp. SID13031]NEA37457.1 hypothetical protein [Streptomyces sp. SID13031]
MNTQLTPPPDHDLRPATRNRQRDELIAIVDHESAQATPRRRLVPLAAAAAVVAVTAGLAIGVPALRGDKDQPPVSGADAGPAKPAVEPLTAAEQKNYVKACQGPEGKDPYPARVYTVADAFKWVNPPAGTHATAWVVLNYKTSFRVCGFGATGKPTEWIRASGDRSWVMREQVDKGAVGGGTYTKSVTRVTVASDGGPGTEAILRNGFFFAPMKQGKPTVGEPKPDSPQQSTVQGYDASGKLVFATPKTYREEQARIDSCYTNPEGTKVVYSNAEKPRPTPSQCKRGFAWGW